MAFAANAFSPFNCGTTDPHSASHTLSHNNCMRSSSGMSFGNFS